MKLVTIVFTIAYIFFFKIYFCLENLVSSVEIIIFNFEWT